jgi:hypothetical protein
VTKKKGKVMVDNGKVRPCVDYERRIFVARDGTEVRLKPISRLILERLYNDVSGKPSVPKVEVEIAGTHKRLEDNPENPAYKTALANWEGARNLRITRYFLTHGVADNAPDTFVKEYREFFPNADDNEMRYLWMVDLLGEENQEDWQLITQAITGQTAPTAKGIEQAEAAFPGNGQRDTDQPIPAVESAD